MNLLRRSLVFLGCRFPFPFLFLFASAVSSLFRFLASSSSSSFFLIKNQKISFVHVQYNVVASDIFGLESS